MGRDVNAAVGLSPQSSWVKQPAFCFALSIFTSLLLVCRSFFSFFSLLFSFLLTFSVTSLFSLFFLVSLFCLLFFSFSLFSLLFSFSLFYILFPPFEMHMFSCPCMYRVSSVLFISLLSEQPQCRLSLPPLPIIAFLPFPLSPQRLITPATTAPGKIALLLSATAPVRTRRHEGP